MEGEEELRRGGAVEEEELWRGRAGSESTCGSERAEGWEGAQAWPPATVSSPPEAIGITEGIEAGSIVARLVFYKDHSGQHHEEKPADKQGLRRVPKCKATTAVQAGSTESLWP